MRVLVAVLLLGAAFGYDKPKKKTADPRLKLKPHVWKTSAEDLATVKAAEPKKGTWAEPIFSKADEKGSVAAAALEAREQAKAREQKAQEQTTSTTTTMKPKPAAKKTVATTTTTTTTTKPKVHKYWKPDEEKSAPVASTEKKPVEKSAAVASVEKKPVPVVNFHNTNNKIGSGAPSGPAAAMMKGGPGPAPAPAPAPLTYEQQVAKLKGDMMNKIKVDSFDADLIIHRPTKVPPGPESTGKETPVPEFKDVGSDFGPYAGKPGFPPAAKPLKHDDISFKTGSLPVDAAHKDRETMTSDFGMEYGPNGPKGMHGARPQAGNFEPLKVR